MPRIEPRIDLIRPHCDGRVDAPAGALAVEGVVEARLLDLIKLRAAQISGCPQCIEMHSKAARAHGETEQRLVTISAWLPSRLFSERERAALSWTEVVTHGSEGQFSEQAYAEARACLDEQSLVALTSVIFTIKSWNHFCIASASAAAGQAAA